MICSRYLDVCRRWLAARGGAAAVEFAIVIPILAAMVMGVGQYGGEVIAYQHVHNGVMSGAQYVMRGGSDATAIHDITYQTWPNKPQDAAVVVSEACTCAGAAAGCSGLCPDSSYPQSATTITATGTYIGPFGNQAMTATQVIRTQ